MKKSLISCSIFLLLTFLSYPQSTSKAKIFETYDHIVGLENTGLYNGTSFTDFFLNTDGTYRYFVQYDYTRGSVKYNNQFYSNVNLKYDIFEDNLLTSSSDNLSVFNVELLPEFVESFSIFGHDFVRLTDTHLNRSGNGYFEKVYVGANLDLYIKHAKKKRDKALNTGVQYRFSENNYYLLKHNGNYFSILSIRDMRKIMPEKAKMIRDFRKSYKSLYKADPDTFMTKLVTFLDGSY